MSTAGPPMPNWGWEYNANIEAFTLYHKIREEQGHDPSADSLLPALGHGIAGAAGSAVSNFVVYPLSLVIARLQTQARAESSASKPEKADEQQDGNDKGAQRKQPEPAKKYSSLPHAVAKIHADEGVAAFYAGVGYDTAKTVADSFLFFLAYNVLSRWRRARTRSLTALDEILIGVVAGAFSKALTNPLSQVVTRTQTAAARQGKTPGILETMQSIKKERGLQGLWAGYSAQLILTLNPSLTMLLDSALQRVARLGEHPSSLATFLVAATSKVVATCVTYPVGLAKTRAQASAGKASSGGPGGVLLEIPKLAREQGVGALYAGLESEVLKGFLQHGLTMMVKSKIHALVIGLYFALVRLFEKEKKDVRLRPN